MWVSVLSCGNQLFPDGRRPHSVVHMNGTHYNVGWHNGQQMRKTGVNQMAVFVRGTRVITQHVRRTDKADRIMAGGALAAFPG